jgi:fluoride ion exporter CrcB/FEX
MSPLEILGVLSALMTLSAFVANEWEKLSADSILYDAMNFIASIGLFSYAYHLGAVPFMLTNTVWGIVSGADVLRYLLKRKGLKKRRK